ncbi:MAG: ATP-binding protein [Microcystaceae cyanobacterium]
MSLLKKCTFTVNSDLQCLDRVLETFEQLYQPWIIKKDWLQCQLALAEGFTNAVRHAHGHLSPDTPIKVELTLYFDKLEIRIWDRGAPFDLKDYLQKIALKLPQLQSHGQGLPILQKIATHLSYTRTDAQGNCLLIIKQFSAS